MGQTLPGRPGRHQSLRKPRPREGTRQSESTSVPSPRSGERARGDEPPKLEWWCMVFMKYPRREERGAQLERRHLMGVHTGPQMSAATGRYGANPAPLPHCVRASAVCERGKSAGE
jgi:hypothetical protein